MNSISLFFSYLLIIVFGQNLLFIGSVSPEYSITCAKKPIRLVFTAALTSLFTLLAALTLLPFDYLFPLSALSANFAVRAAALIAALLLWYLAISKLVDMLEPLRKKLVGCVFPAAFNGAAIGAPLLLWSGSVNAPAAIIGCALGSGISFLAASLLLNAGMRRADNPDIPKALRGTPIMLIYIGLLSLGFSAFGAAL